MARSYIRTPPYNPPSLSERSHDQTRLPPARLLAVVLLMSYAPLAQTRAQNDKAAADAVKNKGLPLLTDRPLSFTTSEATWLSLDLSPDGNTIVFELLGDLYTLPVTGGEATRITSGQGYDMQPAFSPDGKKLVVHQRSQRLRERLGGQRGRHEGARHHHDRARELHVADVGAGRRVRDRREGSAALDVPRERRQRRADDGREHRSRARGGPGPAAPRRRRSSVPRLVRTRESLWVNVRGNVRAGLTTRLIEDESHPDYDPHTPSAVRARVVGPYQIAQLDRETGRLLVRTHEHEGAFRPVPSPDGKWLVYSTRHDARQALKLIDLSTGEDRWLRMDVQRDDSQGGGARDRDVYPKSAFTPDSKSLITSYDGKIWRVAGADGEAIEIPFTAKVDQQLGPLVKFDYPIDDEKLRVSQIRGARPSPDGKRVVFTALDRLWIADLPQGRGTKKEKPAGAGGDADKKPDADARTSRPPTSPPPTRRRSRPPNHRRSQRPKLRRHRWRRFGTRGG